MATSLSISKNSFEKTRRKEDNSFTFSNSELPPVPSFLLSASNYSNIAYYDNDFSDEEDVIVIESDDDSDLEEVLPVDTQENSLSFIPLSNKESKVTPNSNENLTSSQINYKGKKKERENIHSSISPRVSPKLSPKTSPKLFPGSYKDKTEQILGKRKDISLGDKLPLDRILSALQRAEPKESAEKEENDIPNPSHNNNTTNDEVIHATNQIEVCNTEVETIQSSMFPPWLKKGLEFSSLTEEERRSLMSSVSEFPTFPIIEIPTRKSHTNNARNNNHNNGRYGKYGSQSLSYYKLNSGVMFHDFPSRVCDLLETELELFYKWISPTSIEEENRMNTISDITSVVKDVFATAEVAVYGSVATGLCLPTSDIDMVIMSSGNCSLNLLFSSIKLELIERKICDEKNIKIIHTAMVPIIKLVHKCGIPVDISYGNRSFLDNLSVVKSYLHKYEYAKSIIYFLKQLLHQQNLNITYSGGLGSYPLVVVVLHFIQVHENIKNTGELLLRFLQCYGFSFDYCKFGISCYHQGSYFLKEEKNWFDPWSPSLLSVEDPLDEDNDLGRKSFNIQEVRILFADVYKKIIHKLIDEPENTQDHSSISLLSGVFNEFSRNGL